MIQLNQLKNHLEDRVTVLRVYRSISLELNMTPEEWKSLCEKIYRFYKKLGGQTPVLINQKKIFGKSKSKKKTKLYPVEFIPIMVNIIKDHIKDDR